MRFTYRLTIRKTICGLTAALLLTGAAAWADTLPFGFTAFGGFKRMSHTGDTGGQVKLADLPQSPGTWGVGALAGLAGEVLLYDGRLLVSRGDSHKGMTTMAKPSDEAVLFAAARVQEWRDLPLPSDMTQVQFEAFVVKQAMGLGLDINQPFPFLVDGRFPDITWHVVTGQTPNMKHGGGHANKHAGMKVFEQSNVAGRLVSVYSGAQYEGVVSHPGQRFHVHYVDELLRTSGHVDVYSLASGTVLKLPVK
jgi:alpha-acetolactate decarboxylase